MNPCINLTIYHPLQHQFITDNFTLNTTQKLHELEGHQILMSQNKCKVTYTNFLPCNPLHLFLGKCLFMKCVNHLVNRQSWIPRIQSIISSKWLLYLVKVELHWPITSIRTSSNVPNAKLSCLLRGRRICTTRASSSKNPWYWFIFATISVCSTYQEDVLLMLEELG